MSDVTEVKALNVYQAIQSVMTDMKPVGKDGVNQMQRWKYRAIDDIYNALHPALAKHGLCTIPNVYDVQETNSTTKSGAVQTRVVLKVRYDLYAADGSSIFAIVYGEGVDTGDKAIAKAMTYAYKYFLMQTFCIALESEKDPDETIVDERVAHIDQAPHTKVEPPRLASTMTDGEIKTLIWPHMQLLKIEAKHGLKIVAEIKKANIAMNDLGAIKSTLATLKRIIEEQL